MIHMKAKVLLFDTETTALKGDLGHILCISYKWLGEKAVHTLRIDDFPLYKKDPIDDTALCKAFAEIYSQAEVSVAHYGAEFDVKQLSSRCAINGLPPLPKIKCYDTWYAAKQMFNLKSNSVKNLAEIFGLKEKKMPVPWLVWRRAMSGHKPSLDILSERCESDVRVLELIYNKLVVWAPQYLPNVHRVANPALACRVCGTAGRMHRRGYGISAKNRYERYQCQKCAAWQKGPTIKD